jgi:hypothetical protein
MKKNMQVTLVAYYGSKPTEISNFLRLCQDKLCAILLSAFHPYDMEQVHATIIGLEGIPNDTEVLNLNFREINKKDKPMNPDKIMSFLERTKLIPFEVRIGGYRHYQSFPFSSRSQHPYIRSFSVQGPIAVAMGWPVAEKSYPPVLERLRRQFQKNNVLHKWHNAPKTVDNDFYFVLGRIDRDHITKIRMQELQELMRQTLAGIEPLLIPIERENLSIVGYYDNQLPHSTSSKISLSDAQSSPEKVRNLYANTMDGV